MAIDLSIDARKYSDIVFGKSFLSDSSGTITTQTKGVEAIKGVIKLYLLSIQGDYGRDFNKGGILFDFVGKILNQENADALAERVRTGIENYYRDILVNEVRVSLDIENKMFVVSIFFSDTFNKFFETLNVGIPGE